MKNIDVNDVIDNAKFNAFHWRVLVWCTLIIIFDGYDLVIYGVVLPLLMQQWNLVLLQHDIALFSQSKSGPVLGVFTKA